MQNKRELWLLHQIAQYPTRPSEIIGIQDSWLAYQLDVATLLLGRKVEGMTAEGKMTADAALGQLMAEAGAPEARPAEKPKQAFASLKGWVMKKIVVPAKGTGEAGT